MLFRKQQLITLLIGVGAICTTAGANGASVPIYQDKTKTVDQRVNDLLSRMTTEEKVTELCEDWGIPGNARLGIPPLSKTEAVHGFGYGTGATIFPQAIGVAATWDTGMVRKVGDTVGEETVEAQTSQAWSPVLDVARDARWGRVEETFGEDPYLVSRMGVNWIEAFQAHNLIATPKHFAAHGGPLGGRDSNDVGYSERVMREVYLVPFRAAFEEAKAGSVMNAYSAWVDGVPDVESQYLLKGILRQEWGFDGFVVSDCGSVENMVNKFSVAADGPEASKLAIEAGVSCNCGDEYKKSLLTAVKSGLVSPADLDFAVGRILTTIYRLGLFDHPIGPKKWDNNAGWDSPAHRQVALQTALESIVLLKNDNNTLPLSKNVKSIAVIGPDADDPQTGDYTGTPKPGQVISVLAGIKKAVSANTVVKYAKGCDQVDPSTAGFADAVNIAQQSDVVVMVLGDNEKTSGENNDRANVDLTGVQEALLESIYKTGKPVILVLSTGKPTSIPWAATNVPAIIETWFPGEEGGDATAQVLFGDYNPGGRLPATFPRSSDQLPLYYNYEPSGRGYNYTDISFTPQFRFGYGLSYTSFKYGNLQITAPATAGGNATVSADVTNTGSVAGDEVPQLYISHTVSSVVSPVMELKGFERIHLEPNATSTVTFTLTPYALSVLDRNMDRVVETGPVKIMVGGASPEALTNDGQKQHIGFKTPDQGVNGELDIKDALAPSFAYSIDVPGAVSHNALFHTTVLVKNAGSMTDVGDIKLYANGNFIGTQRFEVNPQDAKPLDFPVTLHEAGVVTLTAVGKYSVVTKVVHVK